MDLLPLFVKLDGRRVVVVGTGWVAASKLDALVRAGADIHVVEPDAFVLSGHTGREADVRELGHVTGLVGRPSPGNVPRRQPG